jgi:hypothetical protein
MGATAMTITDQKADKVRAEIAGEWQRLHDYVAAEWQRIEERLAAERRRLADEIVAADARIMFILDRLQEMLASDGNPAEMLAEVEELRNQLAARRTGVAPAETGSKLN